jgi:hypothetical protein
LRQRKILSFYDYGGLESRNEKSKIGVHFTIENVHGKNENQSRIIVRNKTCTTLALSRPLVKGMAVII